MDIYRIMKYKISFSAEVFYMYFISKIFIHKIINSIVFLKIFNY